jgi:DNA-binding GntR family transcriptional regulator
LPNASQKSKPAPAEAESLTDRAYVLLEEMIATLQLAPGTLVSEAELSAQLGIGRTPVREAMQRLARERLLVVLPRRGCIVTPIRPEEEVMLIETRRAIETLVVETAARRATDAERRRFGEIAAQMKQALRTQDFDAFARLDTEFNRL